MADALKQRALSGDSRREELVHDAKNLPHQNGLQTGDIRLFRPEAGPKDTMDCDCVKNVKLFKPGFVHH